MSECIILNFPVQCKCNETEYCESCNPHFDDFERSKVYIQQQMGIRASELSQSLLEILLKGE